MRAGLPLYLNTEGTVQSGDTRREFYKLTFVMFSYHKATKKFFSFKLSHFATNRVLLDEIQNHFLQLLSHFEIVCQSCCQCPDRRIQAEETLGPKRSVSLMIQSKFFTAERAITINDLP